MSKAVPICVVFFAAAWIAAQQNDPSWEPIRKAAEAEHQIMAVAMKQHDFTQVLPEMRRVYALRFPGKYEVALSREIEIVSDFLMHEKQYDLAHKIIDEGLVILTRGENKAAVLKEKAYILRKQGKEEDALRCFREALRALATGHHE